MKLFRKLFFLNVYLFLITPSVFAGFDRVQIKTRNGVFDCLKEKFVTNPLAEGTLLNRVFSTQVPVDRDEDGSYYFDIDEESMRFVLNYLSGSKIDPNSLVKNDSLERDLNYLMFNDVLHQMRDALSDSSKIWICEAFCKITKITPIYKGSAYEIKQNEETYFKSIYSDGNNIFAAWNVVQSRCSSLNDSRGLYSRSQNEFIPALMVTSCKPIKSIDLF